MAHLTKKPNLFDIIFAIIILSAVIFYFGYFKRATTTVILDIFTTSSEWSTADFKSELYPMAQNINSGDTIFDSLGRKVAEITYVSRTPEKRGLQENYLVTLTLKTTYNKKTKTYTYDGNPLLIGGPIKLNTGKALLQGQIFGLYRSEAEKLASTKLKNAKITVKYRHQDPWLINPLKQFEYFDSNKKLLLKTTSVQSVPSPETFPNSQGQLVLTSHPFKYDLTTTFEIYNLECTAFNCLFNHIVPISIGGWFVTDFGNLNLVPEATITDVQYF